MGVKDLWQLLAPIGRRVSVESLEGKTLAIDASIWITQFIKAMRDEDGKMMKNAHLIGTLRRVLRLLFHKIRPLFVFDGATPELKLRTVQSRRRGRELQEESKRVAAQRLLRAQLRQRAVQIASSGENHTRNGGSYASSFRIGGRQNPPTENAQSICEDGRKERSTLLDMTEIDADVEWVDGYEKLAAKELNEGYDSDGKDEWQLPADAEELNPDVLGALPPHIRKSLIEEARRKQRNVSRSNYLPVAGNPALYSQTQLSNFLSSSKLNKKFVEAQQRVEDPVQGIRIAADGSRKYQIFALNTTRGTGGPAERWSVFGSQENDFAQLSGDEDVFWEPNASSGLTRKENIHSTSATALIDSPRVKETLPGLDNETPARVEIPEPVLPVEHHTRSSAEHLLAASLTTGHNTELGGAFSVCDSSTWDISGGSDAGGAKEAGDDVMWESETESCVSDKLETAQTAGDGIPSGSGVPLGFQSNPSNTNKDALVGNGAQRRTLVGPISSEAMERAVSTAASMADWAGRAVRQALKVHVRGPGSPLPTSSALPKRAAILTSPANKSNQEGATAAPPSPEETPADALPPQVDTAAAETGVGLYFAPEDIEEDGFDTHGARRRFNRAMRDTESLTEELKDEVIQLLQTMNLPYIVAPFEAEAQCAVLEQLGLVDGVVTEDSDALLFGASTVYKNIFTDKKFVEVYLAEDAKREMGLWREDLVALAYFLGSDYSEGVNGVGIVNATEIIHAFPMHGHAVEEPLRRGGCGIGSRAGTDDVADGPLQGLRRFRDWLHGYDFDGELFGLAAGDEGAASGGKYIHSTGGADCLQDQLAEFTERHRSGRAKWTVPESFPDPRIARAYLKPAASYNPEPFDWKQPVDAVALKTFCSDKLGWTDQQILGTIEPVLQRYAERSTQTRIDAHFMTYHNDLRFAKISSERLKGAVTQITGKRTSVSLGGSATQSGKRKRTEDNE